MYNILAVTNHHLCENDFLDVIKRICEFNNKIQNGVYKNSHLNNISSVSILLREKDLSENSYKNLAKDVIKICKDFNTDCILHTYYKAAKELSISKIHVPFHILKENPDIASFFDVVGVSVHSLNEAVQAQKYGAAYITAGHIFNTNCKKGIPGRGLSFLKNITSNVNIPVFAIGGINVSNIDSVINNGASGICIMSGFMKAQYPENLFQ